MIRVYEIKKNALMDVFPAQGQDDYAVQLAALYDFRAFAATTIQRWWRGHATRIQLSREARNARPAPWNALNAPVLANQQGNFT
jgi:IQ calmodulin-binding motif